MKALLPTGRAEEPVGFGEVDQPRPAAGEAVVKVEAFSVNRGEMLQLDGVLAGGERPGKDIAGLVVQAAADGTGPQVGQRVVGHPPAGGWAEYVAVPTDALAVLPQVVSTVTAAALPLAGLAALRLLRAAGCVSGHRVLITGASGGVGHYFTELAVGAGTKVTAVTATPERGRRLAELGAEVIHHLDDACGPYHVVLESIGGPSTAQALSLLRPRGRMIWFGQASGEPACLNFFDFFAGPRSATVQHFHYLDADEPFGTDLDALVRLVAEGRLHPEIGRTEDWGGTAEVLADLRDRRIRGNAVLTLG
ncbi:zinc-binding dehydrogenase [Streptomyces sp. NPDC052301]|uniref:zinc-binding dehydrogenase n=1 Tax=Streptomyces sp. NPDC052301 TaxID=3365687 RepID=UPI0037D4EDB7